MIYLSYDSDKVCHMTGIYQVYTKCRFWYIPGIYLSYEMPFFTGYIPGIYLSNEIVRSASGPAAASADLRLKCSSTQLLDCKGV